MSAQPAEPGVFDASAAQQAPAQRFEPLVAAVESHVQALSAALCRHEALQVALCAQALQTALMAAQTTARRASLPQHAMPPALHQRLAIAAARATACREAINRSLAAQGRELKVLLPQAEARPATYGADGMTQTHLVSASAQV